MDASANVIPMEMIRFAQKAKALSEPDFNQSVFLNCPFDDAYQPLLQASLFCVSRLGLVPRIAPENADNANPRIDRILHLILSSKYGIHDISRCSFSRKDLPGWGNGRLKGKVFARLNMPFELGVDYGLKCSGDEQLSSKSILVLEENAYDSKQSLSDLAGWDIKSHEGDFLEIIRRVSDWLKSVGENIPDLGPQQIADDYTDFQEWSYEKQLAAGYSDEDIKKYPTERVLQNILEWIKEEMPVSFD